MTRRTGLSPAVSFHTIFADCSPFGHSFVLYCLLKNMAGGKTVEQTVKAEDKQPPMYAAVWRWHFYAGIIFAPFLIILALSSANRKASSAPLGG